jgi:hypothetical protein
LWLLKQEKKKKKKVLQQPTGTRGARCANNPQEQEELDAPTIVDKTIITRNDEYELLDYWINMRVTKFIQENYFN